MAESKKHHFVPQSLLKNFSINDEGERLFILDKESGNSFPSSVLNAGHENQFNTVDLGDSKLNLESEFQEVDRFAPELIRKVLKNESIDQLTSVEYLGICGVAAYQYLRTNRSRDNLQDLTSQINNWVDDLNKSLLNKSSKKRKINRWPNVDKELAKFLTISNMKESVSNVVLEFVNKHFFLYRNTTDSPFWISDNPVAIHSHYSYGTSSLNSHGVEILFPISSSLCLAWLCPHYMKHLEFIIDNLPATFQSHPDYRNLYSFRHAINTGKPVLASNDHTPFINSMQVVNSTRFLYSKTDDFKLAKDILEQAPNLKNVKSTVKLGGQKNHRLPEGDVIVFYCQEMSYMVRVRLKDREKESMTKIDFFVEGFELVRVVQILKDLPITRVEVYTDGWLKRLTKDVEFKNIDFTGKKAFTLGPSPEMEKLYEAIEKSRSERKRK